MKLIVGLGNPGRKYEATRHNVGFQVAARLLPAIGGAAVRRRFDGEFAEGVYQGEKVALLCPQTYMNASGTSVRQAVDFFKLDPESDSLLVVCDDLNLPLGKLRLRSQGSAGGQKGVADIIRKLRTDRFSRLRFGIDRPAPPIDPADYVLGKFTAQQRGVVDEAIGWAVEASLFWVVRGIEVCMNRYNAELPPRSSGGDS